MKILVLFAAFICLCSSVAIPLTPGDNSHYVEDESRYIWMPDGKGTPQLVDLHEPVDLQRLAKHGSHNQYWLYTRNNPTTPQYLVPQSSISLSNSNFRSRAPIKVLVHGWNSDGTHEMNPLITHAFLSASDVNVIVVDWRGLANGSYGTGVAGVPTVGEHLGRFLIWLVEASGTGWNNVHLVGFSLGAHVVGVAGRHTSGRPARVTGLDPAGPSWSNNVHALNSSAGTYVEAIHTDGGLLGLFASIADADFYPNGGRNPQPGCWLSTCSHGRSTQLFAASVLFNHLEGNLCPDTSSVRNCTGRTQRMGNGNLEKRESGIFGLTTHSIWPF